MRILDLFSGLGGFTIAAHEVWDDVETVSFVEIDKRCRDFLSRAWPGVPIHDDIKTLDASKWRGTIDLMVGGPPCQPASRAGKQKGSEDDRWLWDETLRVCEECIPTWCLFENPPGLGDVGLDGILTHLEGIGYEVQTVDIPACAVNSPHRRHRYWIICLLGNSRHSQRSLQPYKTQGGIRNTCDELASSSCRGISLENSSESRTGRECGEVGGQGRQPVDSGPESIRCGERKTCTDGVDTAGADMCLGHSSRLHEGKQNSQKRRHGRRTDDAGTTQSDLADTGQAAGWTSERPEQQEPARSSADIESDLGNTTEYESKSRSAQSGKRSMAQANSERSDQNSAKRHELPSWDSYIWLPCADGKVRRAPDDSQCMAHGLPVELLEALGEEGREGWTPEDCEPHRSLLGALGNSVVPSVCVEIFKAMKAAGLR